MLKKIALFCLSFSLMLFLAEISFRIFANYHKVSTIEAHRLTTALKDRQNSETIHLVLMGKNVTINEDGLRGSSISPKSSDIYRILVVGDSLTFGWGVGQDEIYTTILQHSLNQSHPIKKVEVLNAGIINLNSVKKFDLLKELFAQTKPDYVIIQSTLNDSEPYQMVQKDSILQHSWLASLIYVKLKQSLLSRSSQTIAEYYQSLYEENSKGWRESKKAYQNIKSYCDKRKVPYLFFVTPDQRDLNLMGLQYSIIAKIHSFFDQSKIDYIDIFPAYSEALKSSDKRFWISQDDSHPNKAGHRVIATEIANYLKAYILK